MHVATAVVDEIHARQRDPEGNNADLDPDPGSEGGPAPD
jgi:hypothetical protein